MADEFCFIADDMEYLALETDDEKGTPLLIMDRSDDPIKIFGDLRVRIKFRKKSQVDTIRKSH